MRQRNPPRKCDFCGRTFSRTEHLVRHRRTHTNEKPFTCDLCSATFPRDDVRQKHMRRIHPEQALGEAGSQPILPTALKKSRAKVACDLCRKRKLRCSGESPCDLCRVSNQICTFSREERTTSMSIEQDDRSDRPQQPLLEAGPHSTEMTMDDPMSLAPVGSTARAALGSERQWPPAVPQRLVSDLTQTLESGNVGFWSNDQNQAPAGPELNQSSVQANWPLSYDGAVLGGLPSFDIGVSSLVDAGQTDSSWYSDDFNADFWHVGMDFNFEDGIDGIYDMSSSSIIAPEYLNNQNTQPVLQPALDDHQPINQVTEMMQQYFEQASSSSSPRQENPNRRWFSDPPHYQIYDIEVMHLFTSIAKHHLNAVFPVLRGTEAAQNPRKELHLAYAAVGGLFCNVPGRFKVVNSMYNDARRMLLDPTCQDDAKSLRDKLSVIQTFILLEIYGLCSGDKRSYEFTEVFHSMMLSKVEEYKKALAAHEVHPEEPTNEARALTESLYILEYYRIALLLRPPCSYFRTNFDMSSTGDSTSVVAEENNLAATLFTPGSSLKTSYSPQDNVIALATIALIAWPVFPKGTIQPHTRTLWKPEFIELALNNWAKIQVGSVDWPLLVLYHLVYINLHANLNLVQRFAHSPAKSSLRARSGKAFAWLEQWQKSIHYRVAKWHAQSILWRVKDAVATNQKRPSEGLGDISSSNGRPAIFPEPPHLPYCVYYAALVIWCGCVVSHDEKISEASSLETCSQLLGGMEVRVAELLDGILQELKLDTK